jgi:flagellar M-ring protein FliF
VERRIKAQVEEIVASVVGSGRARVQVAADLDMNRIESRSETFDPESKVARSSQTRTENSVSSEGKEGQVSVGNELPGAQQNGQGAQQRDVANKNEEVVNYEISRTTRSEVLEGGRVRKLSVAVLVDGVYPKSANGEISYQPRPQEDLERIGQLVRTAIGFDKARGDQVEVVNLRFADAPTAVEMPEQTLMQRLLAFTKDDILRIAEMLVVALLTILVLFTVVRPLLRQVIASDAPPVAPGGGHPGMAHIAYSPSGEPLMVEETASDKMLAIAQVKGELKAKSVEKIGTMVNGNPLESAAVLRGWIHEPTKA